MMGKQKMLVIFPVLLLLVITLMASNIFTLKSKRKHYKQNVVAEQVPSVTAAHFQDEINNTIETVQAVTANPKTDTRLGKVGR